MSSWVHVTLGNEFIPNSSNEMENSNDESTETDTTSTTQNQSLQGQPSSFTIPTPQQTQNQVSSQQNANTQSNEWSQELRSTNIKAVILSCWDNTVGPKTLRIWHGMVCKRIML